MTLLPALYATSAAGPTDGVAGVAVAVMEALGAPGAGVAVALENLLPPVPSEVILPLAGFTASRGEMSLIAALLWTTLGSVVGALVLYLLGSAFGRRRTRAVVARLPLVAFSDLDRAERWFSRHGRKAVLFGRMVPVVRSLVSLPAGVERMPVGQFVLLTMAGSFVWNCIFVLAGYWLGERWPQIEPYGSALQKTVLAAAVITTGVFVVVRVRAIRHRAPS